MHAVSRARRCDRIGHDFPLLCNAHEAGAVVAKELPFRYGISTRTSSLDTMTCLRPGILLAPRLAGLTGNGWDPTGARLPPALVRQQADELRALPADVV
jgi:hypothetical protein